MYGCQVREALAWSVCVIRNSDFPKHGGKLSPPQGCSDSGVPATFLPLLVKKFGAAQMCWKSVIPKWVPMNYLSRLKEFSPGPPVSHAMPQ